MTQPLKEHAWSLDMSHIYQQQTWTVGALVGKGTIALYLVLNSISLLLWMKCFGHLSVSLWL